MLCNPGEEIQDIVLGALYILSRATCIMTLTFVNEEWYAVEKILQPSGFIKFL